MNRGTKYLMKKSNEIFFLIHIFEGNRFGGQVE